MYCGRNRRGIARRPHDQCHLRSAPVGLIEGEVVHLARLIPETRVFDVLDHPDDFNLGGTSVDGSIAAEAVGNGKNETPSDGTLVPIETARHAFVDNRHLRSGRFWTL